MPAQFFRTDYEVVLQVYQRSRFGYVNNFVISIKHIPPRWAFWRKPSIKEYFSESGLSWTEKSSGQPVKWLGRLDNLLTQLALNARIPPP